MGEKCYFHRDRDAQVWREPFIFGEPSRVPLCSECAKEEPNALVSLYPLNEFHIEEGDK